MAMELKVGDKAPDFTLASADGNPFTLSRHEQGKACIIYFYPKDFTSGCTAQACSFRDHFEAFRDIGVEVIGISKDSVATHKEFKTKYQLPFILLSDPTGAVAEKYNAKIPFIGMTKRITYLLDSAHVVRHIYTNNIFAKEHVKKMLAEVEKE